MSGVGNDRGVGGKSLQCVARRGRQQDRGKLGRIERLGARRHTGTLEKRDIEADVVADETRRALAKREGDKESDRLR